MVSLVLAKRHAGHRARQHHVAHRLDVLVGHGRPQPLADRGDRLDVQRVGDRVGVQIGVGLDGMAQGIHAGGGHHRARGAW